MPGNQELTASVSALAGTHASLLLLFLKDPLLSQGETLHDPDLEHLPYPRLT